MFWLYFLIWVLFRGEYHYCMNVKTYARVYESHNCMHKKNSLSCSSADLQVKHKKISQLFISWSTGETEKITQLLISWSTGITVKITQLLISRSIGRNRNITRLLIPALQVTRYQEAIVFFYFVEKRPSCLELKHLDYFVLFLMLFAYDKWC